MKKVRDSIHHKINPRLTQARKTKNKKECYGYGGIQNKYC